MKKLLLITKLFVCMFILLKYYPAHSQFIESKARFKKINENYSKQNYIALYNPYLLKRPTILGKAVRISISSTLAFLYFETNPFKSELYRIAGTPLAFIGSYYFIIGVYSIMGNNKIIEINGLDGYHKWLDTYNKNSRTRFILVEQLCDSALNRLVLFNPDNKENFVVRDINDMRFFSKTYPNDDLKIISYLESTIKKENLEEEELAEIIIFLASKENLSYFIPSFIKHKNLSSNLCIKLHRSGVLSVDELITSLEGNNISYENLCKLNELSSLSNIEKLLLLKNAGEIEINSFPESNNCFKLGDIYQLIFNLTDSMNIDTFITNFEKLHKMLWKSSTQLIDKDLVLTAENSHISLIPKLKISSDLSHRLKKKIIMNYFQFSSAINDTLMDKFVKWSVIDPQIGFYLDSIILSKSDSFAKPQVISNDSTIYLLKYPNMGSRTELSLDDFKQKDITLRNMDFSYRYMNSEDSSIYSITIKTGFSYYGTFKNFALNGKGYCINSQKDSISGYFTNAILSGLNTEYFNKNRLVYKGEINNRKMNGLGIYHLNDSMYYEGNFIDNLPDGKGKVISQNNFELVGTWHKGKLVGSAELSLTLKDGKSLVFLLSFDNNGELLNKLDAIHYAQLSYVLSFKYHFPDVNYMHIIECFP